MTDPELRLQALWDEDEPPARDPAFVIAVMERVERRRMAVAGAWVMVMTGALGAAAWALAPVMQSAIQPLVHAGPNLGVLAGAVALAVALCSWASGRPHPAGA